ncbi:MAG: Gfo/Idh/MocA family oxidoreductase [Bacteroidales bacterium]|nr:Gfo/Idh/MocA family oxidoreductase [Bacteroidales bacterium]
MNEKPIRVGVVGARRGQSFADGATDAVGMKLVAICDTWEEKLHEVGSKYSVAQYSNYDEFLKHDLDAVILANYFHEHAPLAIKALKAGKHVMSETAACKTLAEGAALCQSVEESGKIYMFAENYPYSAACQELRRIYKTGEVGDVRYAEGEYNHPGEEDWRLSISPGRNHWRNWLPCTYYCSHALAPLMYITDTMPKNVNALSIIEDRTQSPNTVKISDIGSVILVRMDNGAVFRIWGLMLSSIHRIKYEVHGDCGYIATAESNCCGTVRIHHEDWLRESGKPNDISYNPDWPEYADLAKQAGHGGGDFWMNFHFANSIRSGEQPYLNVYRGVAMSAVGILGWRSCLEEGKPFNIPDFQNKEERRTVENDHWSPFPEDAGAGQPPPSIRGFIEPSSDAITHAKEVWAKQGYIEE